MSSLPVAVRPALFALLVILSGCATHAQREFQAIRSANQANSVQFKTCLATIRNSPDYAILLAHVPENSLEATLEQLSDATYATPEQVQAIYAAHPKTQACRKAFLTNLAQAEPSLVPIFTAAYAKADDNLLALVQRKLNWGQFIHASRANTLEAQGAIHAEDQRMVAGLRQENQAELEQRQRAAQALANWAQTQQMINAINRPVVTNCNSFGNTVNCVSR